MKPYIFLGIAAFTGAWADTLSTNTIFRLIGSDIGENNPVIRSLYSFLGSNAPYFWFPLEGGIIFLGSYIMLLYGLKFVSTKRLSTCLSGLLAISGFFAFFNNLFVILEIVNH